MGAVLPLAAHAKKIIRVIARKYRITSQDNCIEIRICLLKKKRKKEIERKIEEEINERRRAIFLTSWGRQTGAILERDGVF